MVIYLNLRAGLNREFNLHLGPEAVSFMTITVIYRPVYSSLAVQRPETDSDITKSFTPKPEGPHTARAGS